MAFDDVASRDHPKHRTRAAGNGDGAGSNSALGDLDNNLNLDLLIGASNHGGAYGGGVYGMLTFY